MKNKTKTKTKNKSKRVVEVVVDQAKPSENEITLRHTDLQTNTHTPAHTPTNTPLLPTTADTASVTSGVSREVPEEDLDRRSHRRLVGPPPSDSLNAGQMSPACRNRSDRDAPSNVEAEGETVPQHSRDLEGGIRRPYEQLWQRDLRLRRRDDWCSDESDQGSVDGDVRTGNREPRYYRDGEIPVSRLEVVSSRPAHRGPEVSITDAEINYSSEAPRDGKDVATPIFSTIICCICHDKYTTLH